MNQSISLTIDTSKSENLCRGNYFRCYVNKYYNNKSQEIVSKVSFIRLKRKSCNGTCATDKRRPDFEYFEEDVGESFDIVVLPTNPIDGAVYELKFNPLYTDYETGYLEEWEWVLTKLKED